jgi:molybdate transport system substrate-binding protein
MSFKTKPFPSILCGIFLSASGLSQHALADEASIAVAANFSATAKVLKEAFEAHSDHTVTFSFSSTGKLYTQITHGAPFDAFFSADAARAELLTETTKAPKETLFTYAQGQLALYSTVIDVNEEILKSKNIQPLGLANPKLAPYGLAAQQTLEKLDLWSDYAEKRVLGDSVTQAFQMANTGAVQAGFVALSQVIDQDESTYWIVPSSLYDPIIQKAVVTERGIDNEAAHAFIDFVKSEQGKAIIKQQGYQTEF